MEVQARFEVLERALADLQRRQGEMERRLRRWRVATLAAFTISGILAAAVLIPAPGMARGQRNDTRAPFRVVDEDGKPLVEITGGRNGAQLALFNGDGKLAAGVGAGRGGGFIQAYDAAGQGPLAILQAQETGGIVAVSNPQKKPEAALASLEAGGMLEIFDRNGNPVAKAFNADAGGAFDAWGRNGKETAVLGTAADGAGALQLYTKDGAPSFSAK